MSATLKDEILATLQRLDKCTFSFDGRKLMNQIRDEVIVQVSNLDADRAAAKNRMCERFVQSIITCKDSLKSIWVHRKKC